MSDDIHADLNYAEFTSTELDKSKAFFAQAFGWTIKPVTTRGRDTNFNETYEGKAVARLTGLEPATPGVTGRYSNQLSYNRASACSTSLSNVGCF